MFPPLLGHPQPSEKTDPRALYLYFNVLWDPKCLQIILQECKIHKFVYIKIFVTALTLKG